MSADDSSDSLDDRSATDDDTHLPVGHGGPTLMFGTGVPPVGLVLLVLLGFTIATTVNTFAMEAAVLFVPAFLFVFPLLVPGFPSVGVNAAIGLALFVELFGYSSSVSASLSRRDRPSVPPVRESDTPRHDSLSRLILGYSP